LTYTIIAVDLEAKSIGIATATAIPCVGAVVPHVKINVGAIATQAYTNVWYGIRGIRMLELGLKPKTIIQALTSEDELKNYRQVAIINITGEKAAYTGDRAPEFKGEIIGENYIAIGNLLVGRRVLDEMASAFETANGDLAEKLLKALIAGDEAGGDRRGKCSAALLIAGPKYLEKTDLPLISIRVDYDNEPVKKLVKVYEEFKRTRMRI